MIVIDVGCATYGGDSSIPYLVDEFKPERLYGFDPAAEGAIYMVGDTQVIVQPEAMWTRNGTIGFKVAGLRGHVDPEANDVLCRDLAEVIIYLRVANGGQEVALKMDAEGSEWVLIPHLIERDADMELKLAWVEWHCGGCGRGGGREINHLPNCREDTAALAARVEELEGRMRCEMHRWNR